MEYIESRVILGLLCLIHLFIGYAGSTGAVHGHISKKVLNGVILLEVVWVTAYVIYDNLQTPPYDGWFVASIGYGLVYGLIFVTWEALQPNVALAKDKTYKMHFTGHVRYLNEEYMQGEAEEGKRKVVVLLPYKEEYTASDRPNWQNVRFDYVFKGYIIVAPV